MEKDWLAEYLKSYHLGRENAITSRELERTFCVNGKELRDTINILRREAIPIASDQSGYYYAKTEAELRATIQHMHRRIAGISVAISGLSCAAKSCPTPSESMGGTRGELVPAREVHSEQSEHSSFAEDVCTLGGGACE